MARQVIPGPEALDVNRKSERRLRKRHNSDTSPEAWGTSRVSKRKRTERDESPEEDEEEMSPSLISM